MEICAKNVSASERLQTIIDENRARREDFSIAARNFKNLLDNSRLSVSQMDKLHRQYERILMGYRESRRALDIELPKIVRTRLGAIGHSFRMIGDFYSDSEHSRQTAHFFKLISGNLCPEEPVSDRVTCKDVPREMCQKCKVNPVD
ncbi:uncharacterized protein [Venturia canescens]|uniref:uncharacterized protein n=1 Tax=Venturia canescens TaxID=32260 RepID=UPI001C9D4E45|nr:uncharacterized protein LOC122419379 [Venturia canescens]